MLSLVFSTIAYFVANHYIRRYLDHLDAPKGLTRNIVTFCLAIMIAYGVAFIVDWAVA
jgi:hypothetical protein